MDSRGIPSEKKITQGGQTAAEAPGKFSPKLLAGKAKKRSYGWQNRELQKAKKVGFTVRLDWGERGAKGHQNLLLTNRDGKRLQEATR